MGKRKMKNQLDMKVAVIGDEQTVTGLVLAGMGMSMPDFQNFFVVHADTRTHELEEVFKSYTTRKDICIIIIPQNIANTIRNVVDEYANDGEKIVPTVLEIPTKDIPYDPKKDPIMQRVQMFFGSNPIDFSV